MGSEERIKPVTSTSVRKDPAVIRELISGAETKASQIVVKVIKAAGEISQNPANTSPGESGDTSEEATDGK